MKKNSTQKEILLITGTSFSSRQLCERNDGGNSKSLSEIEQLEEACWNGLIHEMLPEIFEQGEGSTNLYLWQIKTASHFLELELGQSYQTTDAYFSIDPYCFLETEHYS